MEYVTLKVILAKQNLEPEGSVAYNLAVEVMCKPYGSILHRDHANTVMSSPFVPFR